MALKGSGSLVSNILQKSSALDQKLIEISTQKLTKKVEQLKAEVCEYVRQNYVEFHSYTQTTIALEEKLCEVSAEYRRLEEKIVGELKQKISQSSEKRQEKEDRLRDVQLKIDSVQQLVSIYKSLQQSRQSLEVGCFVEAAGTLQEVTGELEALAELGCEAKVFNALQVETATLRSEADLLLSEEWGKHVCWSPKLTPENPEMSVVLKTELKISLDSFEGGSKGAGVPDIVNACKALGTWQKIRAAFAKKLLHSVLKPLIMKETLKATKTVRTGNECIVLKFSEAKKTSGIEKVSGLFKSLLTVFKVVQQVIPGDSEWMWDVGQVVVPEMANLVVEYCLTPSIPKTAQELEQYEQVSSLTSDFEGDLIELGVVGPDFCQLSDYTQNVHVHFAEQKKKDLLVCARSTLMQTIHDTEIVRPPENTESLSSVLFPQQDCSPQDQAVTELSLIGTEDELKDMGATFPVCAISKCVIQFVELLDQTLQQCYASDTASEKLDMFYVGRDMVDLCCAVMPTYHKTDIATIPRAAALFYNNCMYVAHYLIIAGLQIQQHLKSEVPHATFLDQIPIVRRLGEDVFQSELKKQRNSILESLKAFGDFCNVSGEKRDDVYLGVRQGLFQLTQLSRVYKEVFPAHVHRDVVGSLLDVLVSHMVQGVLALEDIVSDDATELHKVLAVVLEKGSSVMQLSEERADDVRLHCGSWGKLQELAVVLNARLREIVDRWAKGKGSLAQHFKPLEVRMLIKALFKNTDRRASALSEIVV